MALIPYVLLVNFILLAYDVIFWFIEPSCLTYRLFSYGSSFFIIILLVLYCSSNEEYVKISIILFFCINVHIFIEAIYHFGFVISDCDISPTICVFTGLWIVIIICCKRAGCCDTKDVIYVSIV